MTEEKVENFKCPRCRCLAFPDVLGLYHCKHDHYYQVKVVTPTDPLVPKHILATPVFPVKLNY